MGTTTTLKHRSTRRTRLADVGSGALTGIVSAGILFGVAELVSAFMASLSSPLVAVGSTFIDFTPPWLKNFAIEHFGTNDKTLLLYSLIFASAIIAAIAGEIARRRLAIGAGIVFALAVVMGACVITRSGASAIDLVPTAVGTVFGLATLWLLVRMLSAQVSRQAPDSRQTPVERGLSGHTSPDQNGTGQDGNGQGGTELATGTNRRRFIVTAVVMAAAAVVLTTGGKALTAARDTAVKFRNALKLPAAKIPAAPLPAGVQAPVAGVVPFITPDGSFYRVDTALVVPEIDPDTWSLRVHGMVDNEFTMSFQDLLDADLMEMYLTLTCVSNVVGGNLVGNAKWLGYPVRNVLARAKPQAGADMVLTTSIDGFSASTPLPVLQDGRNALLAIGMNGEPLPLAHGFPVRMVVPGLYGFVSATKWVVDMEVTTFAAKTGYWTTRGWSSHGPIKMSSRIEVPQALARVKAGTVAVGGTAWDQTVGISKVEVSLDGGSWVPATLAAEATVDTWRQWSHMFKGVSTGTHQVQVRAYDAHGMLQIQTQQPPEPDGSSGWHNITFTAV